MARMSADTPGWFPDDDGRPDPMRAARAAQAKPALPRRFYTEAGLREEAGGFVLVLDGRPARTPGRSPLALPGRAAAAALAAEWQAQRDTIDPATMPLTRLANTAIDGVAPAMARVAEEVARYGASDLLCYRAGEPPRLVERQDALWNPVLDWAREALGARFMLAQGVVFVAQPEPAREAVRRAVDAIVDPFGLAALSTVTSLTGSVLLGLALAHGHLDTAAAWTAAHCDEDFQMEVWGADDEALERRARRWAEMQAAAVLLVPQG